MESLKQIIMDGNGRWAQQRRLPIFQGHEAGVKSLKRVIQWCKALKIPALTVSQIQPGTGPPTSLGCPSSKVMRAAFLPCDCRPSMRASRTIPLSKYIQQIHSNLELDIVFAESYHQTSRIFASSSEYGVCFPVVGMNPR